MELIVFQPSPSWIHADICSVLIGVNFDIMYFSFSLITVHSLHLSWLMVHENIVSR